MVIHDITPVVTASLAVWPGDTPASREVLCDIAKGDTITLSTLRATVHLGAHADAPSHYAREGVTAERLDLRHYLGACQVVSVDVKRGARVGESQVRAPIHAERVLLKTGTFPDPTVFNRDFAAIEPALVDALAKRGVITIGIDTPSVDLFESKDLPAHNAFFRNRMAILEGLVLGDVSDGVYELIALPLRLAGFDASPVRAVLRGMS